MALAMVTHLFAGLLLAAMNLYTLVYHRDRAAWLRLVLIDLVAVAVVTPHILGMFAESQQTLGGLRPLAGRGRPSLLFPLTATYLLMAGYSITPVIVPVALFGSLLTFAFTLLEVSGAFRRRKAARHALTLLLLVVGFVLLGPFTSALVYPFFLPERSLLIGLPALIVLIAWGIAGSKRRTPLRVLGICLGCIMLFSLWGYYFDPRFQKPPMRDAAAFVRGRVAVGDAVLHTSDGSYLPFLVYEHPADNFLLTGDPDPRKPEAVYELWGGSMVERDTLTSEYRRVWLVVALEHSLEFQREALVWFEDRYTKVEQHSVGGIGIYLFDLAGGASGESP